MQPGAAKKPRVVLRSYRSLTHLGDARRAAFRYLRRVWEFGGRRIFEHREANHMRGFSIIGTVFIQSQTIVQGGTLAAAALNTTGWAGAHADAWRQNASPALQAMLSIDP